MSLTQKQSPEELKLSELQRLNQQLRAQQSSYVESQQRSQNQAILSYQAQINTLKQVLQLQQKANMDLQKQIQRMKQERRSQAQIQEQPVQFQLGEVNYANEQLSRENVQLQTKFERLQHSFQQLNRDHYELKLELDRARRQRTQEDPVTNIGSCSGEQSEVIALLNSKIAELRNECREQREELAQLQELGMRSTIRGPFSASVGPALSLSLCDILKQRLAILHEQLRQAQSKLCLDPILQGVKLFALDIAEICGRTLQGAYDGWCVGVKEIMDASELFLGALGGI